MISIRTKEFLDTYTEDGPVLVIDKQIIKHNLEEFKKHLSYGDIFYAIKSNPESEVLKLLSDGGSNFDCASIPEIKMAIKAGATPCQISFGNTIKKKKDIKEAYELGIRLFAVDSIEEVLKISEVAPQSKVFCRILTDGVGAEWPLSKKFGCDKEMAIQVLLKANELGLYSYGISFHVGSQMTNTKAWDDPIKESKEIFDIMEDHGIKLELLNIGGGFPTRYLKDIPSLEQYGNDIFDSLENHFGNNIPRIIIEPGRGMSGDSGTIRTEIVLISEKSKDDTKWVFIDIGKFGGLSETIDESIRYSITSDRNGLSEKFIIAGPTCDSADVLYEKNLYSLPSDIQIGDYLYIENSGVYTSTYSSTAFNGFPPLKTVVI